VTPHGPIDLSNDPMTLRLLASVVQASEAAIISETLDGVITSWNPSAERIFGYAAQEMIGRSIDTIAAPSRPNEAHEIRNRVLCGFAIEQLETERRRKDGAIVHISLTVSPITDETGRMVGMSKIAVDITERKRVEAVLRAQTRKLEEASHALDLAPALVRTLEGEILHWGRGLQALYGWSAAEATGQISHELLQTEPRALLDDGLTALLRQGEWQGELTHTHREGHRVVVVSHWALHRDVEGKPLSVLEVNQDVTEQRWAVAMLEEREARLRSVLETAPDAIITIDDKGIIQSFSQSAERMFGYVAGEVVGRNVKILMAPDHGRRHDSYMRRYLRTGERRIIGIGRQVQARRKDGVVFPMELAVGEVMHGESRIFTGFIRDISVRAKLEQDLRQAQKMEAIGQLTGGLAHDFNNLLTVIQGNLELLQGRLKNADHQELISDALEATDLGAKLSQRLLAFGRRQSLDPKPVDLNALVRGMVDMLRRTLGNSVQVETRLTSDLPITMADPGQVENALLNLAINARDAMPEGGLLIVETGQTQIGPSIQDVPDPIEPGVYVTLAVTDTGSGMSPEVQQRAFEPYFTTKPTGAGSGLGLSMVYGFVKQSGGHVHLVSAPGAGTTVRMHLPAAGKLVMEAARTARAKPAQRRRRRHGVLLVEDDPRVRRIAVRRLDQLGYRVVEADSGQTALDILAVPAQRAAIDVLFTDIAMPGGISGFDLAREVAQRYRDLKILLTSGYAEPAALEDALSDARIDWIGKPHSLDDLDARLRDLLTD
jgi:PAS domain S-box-containing protein